ncbi:MAG: trigger factor [Ruminococcaceae bacterium]|nr:trigger factor [Oscillospiraceae bacterium]
MKKLMVLLLVASMLFISASCGKGNENNVQENDGNKATGSQNNNNPDDEIEPYDYMGNDLTQYIKLGDYTGLDITKQSSEVTEEMFEDAIDQLLSDYSYYEEYTDRTVEMGDTVIADYAGYKDGVAFAGGTATNQPITVSSNSGYIPGFAEAFEGQTPGVEFSFNVTFPSEYKNAALAGQEVTFTCTVHYIRGNELITPELTEEFVKEKLGFNNVEEFKISFRSTVKEKFEFEAENIMYSDLWSQIIDNTEVIKYPEEEVTRVYNNQKEIYKSYADYYGTTYDMFLNHYVGMTDEELKEESRSFVKEDLVMYQLVKTLEVSPTDKEYEEGFEYYADYYETTVEELIEYYGETAIKTTILWQKLMDKLILENNIVE